MQSDVLHQDFKFPDMSENKYCLEIIIPTYQRVEVLLKNLNEISEHLRQEGQGRVSVRVRDNASTDNTLERVQSFVAENSDLHWTIESNEQNIGVEPNCLKLLEESDAKYVMYLGDDDFIATGYLKFILDEITARPETTTVISGYSFLHPDGTITPERHESFDIKRYEPSPDSVRRLMPLGHQLSGLVFRRDGLHQAYSSREDCRNMYPFIFFTGFSAERGQSVYAPKFQTIVSKIAVRHWSYDKSDLLRDALKNYQSLFAGRPTERFLAQLTYLRQNWGKLGGENIIRLPFAFSQVIVWQGLDWITRIALIACLPFLIVRATIFSVPKVFRSLIRRRA